MKLRSSLPQRPTVEFVNYSHCCAVDTGDWQDRHRSGRKVCVGGVSSRLTDSAHVLYAYNQLTTMYADDACF